MTLALHAVSLLAALAAGAPASPSGGPIVLPTRVPGAVADPVGTVVLVRTPEGGVEAVEGATGSSLWRRPAPARALLVDAGTAFLLEETAPGKLRVTAVHLRTGGAGSVFLLPAGAVPAWAGLRGSGGRVQTTVSVAARRDGNTLEVGLDARQVTLGGIGLIRGPEARVVARVDLISGAVSTSPDGRVEPPPIAAPPPPDAPPLVRFHARAADERIMMGGPPPDVAGVLVSEGALVGFEHAPGLVRIHRWSLPGLARGRALELPADADAIWPTLDRRHVALRRARDQRRVDLYALDGESPGPLATLEGAVDIAILADRLYLTHRVDGEVVLSVEDPRRGPDALAPDARAAGGAAGRTHSVRARPGVPPLRGGAAARGRAGGRGDAVPLIRSGVASGGGQPLGLRPKAQAPRCYGPGIIRARKLPFFTDGSASTSPRAAVICA